MPIHNQDPILYNDYVSNSDELIENMQCYVISQDMIEKFTQENRDEKYFFDTLSESCKVLHLLHLFNFSLTGFISLFLLLLKELAGGCLPKSSTFVSLNLHILQFKIDFEDKFVKL